MIGCRSANSRFHSACKTLQLFALYFMFGFGIYGTGIFAQEISTDADIRKVDDLSAEQLLERLRQRDSKFAFSVIEYQRDFVRHIDPASERMQAAFQNRKFGGAVVQPVTLPWLVFQEPYENVRKSFNRMTLRGPAFEIQRRYGETINTTSKDGKVVIQPPKNDEYRVQMSQDFRGAVAGGNHDLYALESNRYAMSFCFGFGFADKIVSTEALRREDSRWVLPCVVRLYPLRGGMIREVTKRKVLGTGEIKFADDLLVREANFDLSWHEKADDKFKLIPNPTPIRLRVQTKGRVKGIGLPDIAHVGFSHRERQMPDGKKDSKWVPFQGYYHDATAIKAARADVEP